MSLLKNQNSLFIIRRAITAKLAIIVNITFGIASINYIGITFKFKEGFNDENLLSYFVVNDEHLHFINFNEVKLVSELVDIARISNSLVDVRLTMLNSLELDKFVKLQDQSYIRTTKMMLFKVAIIKPTMDYKSRNMVK